jgi:hypothetical protein
MTKNEATDFPPREEIMSIEELFALPNIRDWRFMYINGLVNIEPHLIAPETRVNDPEIGQIHWQGDLTKEGSEDLVRTLAINSLQGSPFNLKIQLHNKQGEIVFQTEQKNRSLLADITYGNFFYDGIGCFTPWHQPGNRLIRITYADPAQPSDSYTWQTDTKHQATFAFGDLGFRCIQQITSADEIPDECSTTYEPGMTVISMFSKIIS